MGRTEGNVGFRQVTIQVEQDMVGETKRRCRHLQIDFMANRGGIELVMKCRLAACKITHRPQRQADIDFRFGIERQPRFVVEISRGFRERQPQGVDLAGDLEAARRVALFRAQAGAFQRHQPQVDLAQLEGVIDQIGKETFTHGGADGRGGQNLNRIARRPGRLDLGHGRFLHARAEEAVINLQRHLAAL